MKQVDPVNNYEKTKEAIGYVSRGEATLEDYRRIGFKSGLEVHQQLLTKKKLFCRCPAGIYHEDEEYDAEVIRHMRPTLSELGEYDGTALMEFKTRKNIFYRLNNRTACTYEIDDTPPFPIDREALEIALEISLLCKLNIVGEVHITRKQYLDGSIPTGFQRTAILGVEGAIQLSNKTVRLIQLSIEEDSCREISDVGHDRVYKTDRLGMPLIETVTYPDMETPEELAEAAEYIRFLNRSTGKVRTGMGAGREDVNVSCRGGSRVEIKGVAHNKWIPDLSHVESFRQYALLHMRELLRNRVEDYSGWKIKAKPIDFSRKEMLSEPVREALDQGMQVQLVNLPGFAGMLSHFTQPGHVFADELSDRLKVIACIEKPNMTHSEAFESLLSATEWEALQKYIVAKEQDAQVIVWGPKEDIPTALETIEERCQIAFEGVPNETRKSFENGTTIFERVLPGADRMYPDTDSAPIPLAASYIETLRKSLPVVVADRYAQIREWGIPEDTYHYLLSKNLVPRIECIHQNFGYDPKILGTFFGHRLKHLEGQKKVHPHFNYDKIYALFGFLHKEKLHPNIACAMLPMVVEHPDMQFSSVLTSIHFKRKTVEELLAPVDFLYEKFKEIRHSEEARAATDWLMGQIRRQALGNTGLAELKEAIEQKINH